MTEKKKQRPFLYVWIDAMMASDLDSKSKLVAHTLTAAMNPKQTFTWKSQTTLAAESSLAERSVRSALKELAALGWITVKTRGRSNQYHINLPNGYRQLVPVIPATGAGIYRQELPPNNQMNISKNTGGDKNRHSGRENEADSRAYPLTGRDTTNLETDPVQELVGLKKTRDMLPKSSPARKAMDLQIDRLEEKLKERTAS